MKLSSDLLLERVNLRKSLRNWRVLAIILLALLLVETVSPYGFISNKSPHIARIAIEGFISEDLERDEVIKSLTNDSKTKAVIIYINSPGGSVVGGESLYNSIKELSNRKPVIAVLGGQATSAAYMAAIAADHIIAHKGTLTGSVGVIIQSFEITELANKLGINPITIKSKPLKAVPNPFEKFDYQKQQAIKALIKDVDEMFLSLVIENRKNLTEQNIAEIATATAFVGQKAKDIGLVDQIGSYSDAKKWLVQQKNLDKTLKVLDVSLSKKQRFSLANIFSLLDVKGNRYDEAIYALWKP